MDKKVRNMTILAAISVVFLMLLLVWYVNEKQSRNAAKPTGADAQTVSEGKDPYKAFLNDELFFDSEVTKPSVSVSEDAAPHTDRLYMLAGSVVKDIRITITDEEGKPVSGYPFYVKVDPLGEFKDLDQDGRIYIPDVSAGEYFVELQGVKGFQVPPDPMRVSVKEELEYKVIEDIGLYILSEDEVDTAREDGRQQEAANDADETEHNGKWEGTDAAFGIDVSVYQKEIDRKKVAADGVEFAIIRCGYRGCTQGGLIEDSRFKENIEGAKAAGIGVGVYFFTQAVNEMEAVEEASMVVALVRDYKLEYPVFLDVEGAGGNGRADRLTARQRTDIIKAFCETIESEGLNAGIYSGRYWFRDNMIDDELKDYVHWLAEYRANPLYTGKFSIWQYTSGGTVNGINTRVDLDLIWDGFKKED
ncbi:MAG: glycoside hydrolase family 25 protein [Lachnospiraceae bacterium]|nr:glycoside hydrolase family 25 protein [Lachnospiraceae bacterium]